MRILPFELPQQSGENGGSGDRGDADADFAALQQMTVF